MEFKALSKKISSARLGAKVKCEFIKEGKVEYVDWCKNKQWRLCNLTNRFNFFVCPFRLKMTSKYIKIDQSSWSLIFLSHFFMYVFCDLRSQTAFHARKMKLFAFKDDLFMICTFFLLFFYLELAWKFVHSTLASDQVSAGFSACRFGFFGLPYLSFTIPSISGECFKYFATKEHFWEVQSTNV